MSTSSIIWKVIVGISTPLVVWLGAIGLVLIPWVQRQILYLHQVPMSWGEKLDIPETFGFLKNQVAAFYITTPDGVKLYTWLIAPLSVYAKHEEKFLRDHEVPDAGVEASAVFKMLRSDPESRLVIYCQTRRTDEYRILASSSPKTYILTFDYRGFGHSHGSPTETTVTLDGLSIVTYALSTLHIPPSRIVLLGQSLGTAVATATASHFALLEPEPVHFAGLMLCAAFTDAASVFLDFKIPGVGLWLMAPLRVHPIVTAWFQRRYKDRWMTGEKLGGLIRANSRNGNGGSSELKTRITLVHALGDRIIPWRHCEELFYTAVAAAASASLSVEGRTLTRAEIDDFKETVDFGEGGWQCVWREREGGQVITQRIVRYGGHDAIMKWGPVALLLRRSFEGKEGER